MDLRLVLYVLIFWLTSTRFSIHTIDAIQFRCSEGWVKLYERCYLIVPYNHTWNEALKYCNRHGAVLAEPKGFELTNQLATEARTAGLNKFWIGYNLLGQTDESADLGYWSDGSQTGVHVGVWAPYEPRVDKGHCAYVGEPWDNQDEHNRWYIDNCNQVYQSVCERTPCPEDTYSCLNGQCVSPLSVCDGINHCGDNSDEIDCPNQCSYLETGSSGHVQSVTSGPEHLYSPNTNCMWTIRGPIGSRIQISFDRFDTETDLDYLELWDGGSTIYTSHVIARLSGSSAGEFTSYMSSTNWLVTRFITDGSEEKSGFSFTWSTEFQCVMRPLRGKAVLGAVENTTMPIGSRQSVEDCNTECKRSATCHGVLYDINQQGDRVCTIVRESIIVQDNGCCDLYIKTCPGETRLESLETFPTLEPIMEATSAKQFLYTPLYPLHYIGNLEMTYTVVVSGTRLITFEILAVDLCCSDRIFLYDGPDPNSILLYTIGQNTESGTTIISTGNTVYVHMQLLAHWSCNGASISFKAGCDVKLTSDTGVIQSPGYGVAMYPGIAFCSWLISPTSASSIRLVFEDFDLEENIDFLKVFENTTNYRQSLHGGDGFSGSSLPATIVTTKNLFVRLSTSAIGSGRGFKASYSSGCPQLSSSNAVLVPAADAYHAPDIVNMTCAEGYYFIGSYASMASVILTCLETGRWDKRPLPECERGYCGFPPTIENGYVAMATGVQGGDETWYQCNPGFEAITSTNITCKSNNQWEPPPQCFSPACENLTALYVPENIDVLLKDGVMHGSVVMIKCPQNYQLIGPQTVECYEGTWKQYLPTCERIECPVPVINHANLGNSQVLYVGDAIYVNCLPGYVIEGSTNNYEAEFKCGIEDPPACTNIDECEVGQHECVGAVCIDTDGSYVCECLLGYQPVGASLTQCEDIDECAEDIDFCDQTCSNTFGSYVCSCQRGYDLYTTPDYNDIKLLTGEDGSKPWHNFYLNHSCVLKKCDSAVVDQLVNGESLTSKTSYFNGDQLEYICNVGFKVSNGMGSSQTILCQQDGTWNIIPSCTPVFCNDISDPEALPAANITYGSKVQKTCIRRNQDILVLERTCGYDHFLREYRTIGDSFICPETECGDPPEIKGTVPYAVGCTYYNCSFTFECRGQYLRMGSSSAGGNSVRCDEDGLWDFGDLSCQGGQCEDPGYPVDGYTTFTSYDHGRTVVYTLEENSVATFHCNRAGYSPVPHDTIICQAVGDGQLAWSDRVPKCQDTERPVFESCPDTIFVTQYYPIDFEVPIPTDNTAVYEIDRTDNIYPGSIFDRASRVRYTAVDYQGLATNCDFWVYITDTLPPKIDCRSPDTVYVMETGVQDVSTADYVNVIDDDAEITAYPSIVHVDISSVGTNPTVDYMAEDVSGNTAVCRIQLRIEGPECDESVLTFKYENVTCSKVGSRTNCVVTCTNSYVFFNDPTAKSIGLSCENGFWSKELPICTDTSDPFYGVWYQLSYTPISGVYSDQCVDLYQQRIEAQLVTLTNALETGCQITDRSIIIMQATDAVEVQIQDPARIRVTLQLEIRPDGLLDSQYSACAAHMLSAFNNKTVEVQSIQSLVGNAVCAQLNLDQNSTSQIKQEFSCLSASQPAQQEDNKHACLACPPGTFHSNNTCVPCRAGTFNTAYYQQSCRTCPVGTNSKGVGLRIEKDCYDWCAMYLHNNNGKTPCTDCPRNTYWVDGNDRARCDPCPAGRRTNGRGARKLEDCLEPCDPGTYSATGLKPCRVCPLNHYQPGNGALTCVGCSSNEITLTVGSKSQDDCLNGYPSICEAEAPCKNNGTCEVIRHAFFCHCYSGFTGRTCETEVSLCDAKPCLNGGTCKGTMNEFSCDCPAQYSGERCEIDGDQCLDISCINNGTCVDQNKTSICTCPSYSGFYGSSCQLPQDPCLKNPCLNDGECIAKHQYYRLCKCGEGFSGVNCEIDLNECTPGLCMNGGTCIDGPNSFTCACLDGYHGTHCHLRNYEYRCPEGACPNGPKCIDDYLTDAKHCKCFPGSRYGSIIDRCEQVSECVNVDCGNNGYCISYDNGYHYKCKCNIGYAGVTCDYNVDDCLGRPCKNEASCVDGIDDYSCLCIHEGTGGKNCTDNDNGCTRCHPDHTASCIDTLTDYTCFCESGYTGKNCEFTIPSCDSLPCQHNGTCNNPDSPDMHTCSCLTPWSGENCETETDHCALETECLNGGTCYSTSNGFICVCPDDYIGSRCEEKYSLCGVANPCVGNSTCTDKDGSAMCQCRDETCINPLTIVSTYHLHQGDSYSSLKVKVSEASDKAAIKKNEVTGYTGISCETLVWFCSETTCLNGGTCSVEENEGIVCNCLEGYSGSDCSINIDECDNNDCPTNSVCVDGINEYICQCHEGLIGESCQKEINHDFDYVISSPADCVDFLHYASFTVTNNNAISIAFWVRSSVLDRQGIILSIYGTNTMEEMTPEDYQYFIKINGTYVSMGLKTSFDILRKERHIENVNIVDGYWHHIVVTWSSGIGELTLYTDGEYNTQVAIGKDEILTNFGLLRLGMDIQEVSSGSTNFFIGRISQLQLYDHEMSDDEVKQAKNFEFPGVSVLNQETTTMLQYTTDYHNHLRDLECLNNNICDMFAATSLPSVASCPGDLGFVVERDYVLEWESAVFSDVDSSVKSNYKTRDVTMPNGVYGISEAGYNEGGDAAVCTFRLYSRNKECETPFSLYGTSPSCSFVDDEDGLVCQLECESDQYSPTQPLPVYQSCSTYGMWDQAVRLTRYVYPTCAAATEMSYRLDISLDYTSSLECDIAAQAIVADTRTALTQLNSQHDSQLCKFENGGNDLMCSTANIGAECVETNKIRITMTLHRISKYLTSGESIIELLMIAIADDSQFTFDAGTPDLQSLDMMLVPACRYGTQHVGDKCVVCGSGTYFDQTLLQCSRCPIGTYRNVESDMELLSECTTCPGSETTDGAGAVSRDNCHARCFLGNYYNMSNGECTKCPRGYYQDTVGLSYCYPCGADQTTYNTGSDSNASCIAISSLTTSTISTSTASFGVNIGASTEAGLSVGVIAAIILSIVIAIIAIVLLVIFCCRERMPCIADKSTVVPHGYTPWKSVNRYGETNLRYANYRLSDVRDYKMKALDRIPIYDNNVSPDDSVNADLLVNVPIFTEKLDGSVNKKQWLMSTGPGHSVENFDMDQTSERPDSGRPDSVRLSSDKRGPGSIAESARTGSERHSHAILTVRPEQRGPGSTAESVRTWSERRGPSSRQMNFSKRKRPGRPPAVLTAIPLPQMLAPISHKAEVEPVRATQEYIRPLPERPRQKVTPLDYQDFLQSRSHIRPHPVQSVPSFTSQGTSHGSDKILLDSDEEDYR